MYVFLMSYPNFFLMIFSTIQVQFRIRIHNLELRIRILQKVSDPYGSGYKTL
jgi:hypothetical protein